MTSDPAANEARILDRIRSRKAQIDTPPLPEITKVRPQWQVELDERQEASRQVWAEVVAERRRVAEAEEVRLAPKRETRAADIASLDVTIAEARRRLTDLLEQRRVLGLKPL